MDIPECFYRVSVKALILNETRDKFLESGYWELPGGGLDWGVTPQEDLPREINEEMGLPVKWIADNPSYFLTGKQTTKPIRFANIVYECELEHLDFVPSDECIEIKFVDVKDIESLTVFESVVTFAKLFRPDNHRKK